MIEQANEPPESDVERVPLPITIALPHRGRILCCIACPSLRDVNVLRGL